MRGENRQAWGGRAAKLVGIDRAGLVRDCEPTALLRITRYAATYYVTVTQIGFGQQLATK